MAGYPGTIASTWQRAGRAGRRQGRSAAVMVGSSAPIDQFVLRNPSYFFDASPEHALVNPDNLHILLDHLKCAAFELPFGAGERFGHEEVQEILQLLAEEGFVHLVEDGGQGPVELDQRVVSGRRREPEVDLLGQLRHRRHDARRGHHRRDRLHVGVVDAAREGDLPHRGEAVPGREARLRGAESVRARRGLRLLHRRDHVHPGDDPGCVRDRVGGAAVARRDAHAALARPVTPGAEVARRRPRGLAGGRLQEDQVLHQRERRQRRARSARAADAHDVGTG